MSEATNPIASAHAKYSSSGGSSSRSWLETWRFKDPRGNFADHGASRAQDRRLGVGGGAEVAVVDAGVVAAVQRDHRLGDALADQRGVGM
jgi:hypothetical protein